MGFIFQLLKQQLVRGFNPFEKYLSNWKSSPNSDDDHKKCWKQPARQLADDFSKKGIRDKKQHLAFCSLFWMVILAISGFHRTSTQKEHQTR